jgi:hypothetical protein
VCVVFVAGAEGTTVVVADADGAVPRPVPGRSAAGAELWPT